jgi:hypothetical protein
MKEIFLLFIFLGIEQMIKIQIMLYSDSVVWNEEWFFD